MLRIFERLRDGITDWCLESKKVSIGDLHKQLNPSPCEVHAPDGNLKFIEQTTPSTIFVKTPSGYSRVQHSHKTVPYDVWEIKTDTHHLLCADDHIVITSDGEERLCKDLVVGTDSLHTDSGPEKVVSVTKLPRAAEPMYDLTLDDAHHVYYTNGILSHNSWLAGGFLLWYAMFNKEQTVIILSNKNTNAMEMIHRVRFIYERLPHWMKPGLADDGWNKHSVAFENDSRIISQATSDDSSRGMSGSLLFLDEFAFVRDTIAEEFWGSVSPTLATGGKCIICSTPNGDTNKFAQLWRGANIPATPTSLIGINGFFPVSVKWNEPPGRDDKFKQAEMAKLGITRWEQEYECIKNDSFVTVELLSGEQKTLSISELYDQLLIGNS